MSNSASPILDYAPRKPRAARLKKFLRVVHQLAIRLKKFFFALLILCMIVAAGMASYYLQPQRYTAVGFLQYTGVGNEPDLDALRTSEAESLTSRPILLGALARATGQIRKWDVTQYLSKIEVRAIPDSKLIEVQCTDNSGSTAAEGVNMIIAQAGVASRAQWLPAQSAAAPIVPHRNPIWALLGSGVMLIALLGWRAWREYELRET